MTAFTLLFFLVLILNILPAFAPPTWLVMVYVELFYDLNHLLIALVGAIAATLGRAILAKSSRLIVRNKFLSLETKENINVLTEQLKSRKKLTASIFLFYAFGPLPSNQLFIAYGLTGARFIIVAIPFFIGRLCSYFFWITTTSKASIALQLDSLNKRSFLIYFVISQIITLSFVYVFAKIDWKLLFTKRRLGWLKHPVKK